MGKLSSKQGQELVAAGLITEKALAKMIEDGKVGGAGAGRSSQPKRVFKGTDISPQVYFRGSKGVDTTDEMKNCKAELSAVIEQYTVLAEKA